MDSTVRRERDSLQRKNECLESLLSCSRQIDGARFRAEKMDGRWTFGVKSQKRTLRGRSVTTYSRVQTNLTDYALAELVRSIETEGEYGK